MGAFDMVNDTMATIICFIVGLLWENSLPPISLEAGLDGMLDYLYLLKGGNQ
jgi:hypothetical protein